MTSLRGGGSRAAEASPINSGATVTMPSASDANQCCQVVSAGAADAVKVLDPQGPADAGNGGPDDRCRKQSQNVAQSIEAEMRTEVALDEARCDQGFRRVAQREDESAQEVPVAQQIGNDGCDHRAGRHRPSRAGPKSDQDAGGNTRRRPEHGHAVGFGQQSKAQPCRQEIGDADRDSEPDRAGPPPHRGSSGGQLALGVLSVVQQHVAYFIASYHVAQDM